MVKGLRLAFEEAEAAGCDQPAIDECKRVYSELRVFTAVGEMLLGSLTHGFQWISFNFKSISIQSHWISLDFQGWLGR